MGKAKGLLLGLALLLAAGTSQALPLYVDGNIGSYLDSTGAYVGNTIDYMTFEVAAGTTVSFNVLAFEANWGVDPPVIVDLNGDGFITSLDPLIEIYDADGIQIDANDDYYGAEGYSDGSIHPIDSYLSHNFASGGTYTLYISSFYYSDPDITLGYNEGWYETTGSYRITIECDGNLSNVRLGTMGRDAEEQPVVPEPATLSLMGLGLGGLVLRRLRRRG